MHLPDVLQVTARGGRNSRGCLGWLEMLEGLETGEVLSSRFLPAPQGRPAPSRWRGLYLKLDLKRSSEQPRQISRAIPGGLEAAEGASPRPACLSQ